ncbi:MAG: glycine cleavage system H protein [Anaerolineales bacterium]
MNIPVQLKYTKSDEWFDPASGKAGITDYAQNQLSDIVFLEIIAIVGETLEAAKPVASVESVKAAGDVYLPVAGKIAGVNDELVQKPETLNSDPYGAGWIVQLEGGDASGLMDAAAYKEYCASRAH